VLQIVWSKKHALAEAFKDQEHTYQYYDRINQSQEPRQQPYLYV